MQLWEGNSKGNFFSVSISKLRWVKIQFLAKKLLETWACIIQLYREPIGLSIELICVEMWAKRTPCFRSLYKSKAQRKRVLIWEEKRWSKGENHAGRKPGGICGICFIDFDEGQAKKSARGMPWHQEPMKDVISCDKLRGAANELWSGDFRMGKPTARYPILNQIGMGGEPPELKHLSRARKRHQPRFRE